MRTMAVVILFATLSLGDDGAHAAPWCAGGWNELWLLFLPAMHGRDFRKRWVLYAEPIREPLLGSSGEA